MKKFIPLFLLAACHCASFQATGNPVVFAKDVDQEQDQVVICGYLFSANKALYCMTPDEYNFRVQEAKNAKEGK